MPSPTSWGSPISQNLRAARKILQCAAFDAKTTPDEAEFDSLEEDALEVLLLIRSWKNRIAPINRIPPEILSTVPDFLDIFHRDQGVITLTHVCRAWREVFVSRPSLWTYIDCLDSEQSHVYLERSGSSPIDLSLRSDLFDGLEFIPGATGRLKSLDIDVRPEDLQLISNYLCRPAPLLEVLSIRSHRWPVLPPSLLNGDLSSLHKLRLEYIRTELPWRNMVNLRSFTLRGTLLSVSLGQLVDFFESAPHLREVDIISSNPIPGTRNGRLVLMACLQRMDTSGHSSSHLFDHLLIPVGARLAMGVDRLPHPSIEGRRPRFLDNLGNLSDFTTIKLTCRPARMEVSGPNGTVSMVSGEHQGPSLLEFLALFDTSKTERLELKCDEHESSDTVYQALLPMKNLHTLKIDFDATTEFILGALNPGFSSSGGVACPRLEELVIVAYREFYFKQVVRMAEARALGGMKLKTVTIVMKWPEVVPPQLDVLELEKHVLRVVFNKLVGK